MHFLSPVLLFVIIGGLSDVLAVAISEEMECISTFICNDVDFVDCTRPRNKCCVECQGTGVLQCSYKGQFYDHGTTFQDGCNTCTCFNGFVTCQEKPCPGLSCTYKGQVYPHGSTFKDDCNSCTCMNGAVTCTGNICPVNCTYNGIAYPHGATFSNTCNTCQCSNGVVTCTQIDCASGCWYDGVHYNEGSVVNSADPCEKCLCKGGSVTCTRTVRCTDPQPFK